MIAAMWGLAGFTWPLLWTLLYSAATLPLFRRKGIVPGRRDVLAGWAFTGLLYTGLWVAVGNDAAAGGAGFSTGIALYLLLRDWWRGKGRRVAKAVGEKSRAVIARLAERVRESAVPVPEGAPG